MCALCLQTPVSASAVELPFVPAGEPEITVTDQDIPMISETQAAANLPETQTISTGKSEISAETTAAEATTDQNKPFDDAETLQTAITENNLLLLPTSSGGEIKIEEETDAEPPETGGNDCADRSSVFSSESRTETKKTDNSSLLIAVICGAAVLAAVTAAAARKKGK